MMNATSRPFLILLSVLLIGPVRTAVAQKKTLGLSEIQVTPSAVARAEQTGKSLELNRLVESLENQLTAAFQDARKFTLVARADLRPLLEEQDFAASSNVNPDDPNAARRGRIAGVEYLLVPTIDDFQDILQTATFERIGTTVTKHAVRVSMIARIYDSTTGELMESTAIQGFKQGDSEDPLFVAADGNLSDSVLVEMAREMSARTVEKTVDLIYPAKVMTKRDTIITINRGDGTGILPGQTWNVYAAGDPLVDPDTGEILGTEEVPVGEARIVSVRPRFSTAELLKDNGVTIGAVLRRD